VLVSGLESYIILEEELGLLRLLDHTLDVLHAIQQFSSPLDLFILLKVIHVVVFGILLGNLLPIRGLAYTLEVVFMVLVFPITSFFVSLGLVTMLILDSPFLSSTSLRGNIVVMFPLM
jgi:hypothetical protein